MKEKESISRRDFLKAAVLTGGLTIAGGTGFFYSKPITGFFKDLVSDPPLTSESIIDEIQQYICVTGKGEWAKRTTVNKAAFATAACMIALAMDPKMGLEKLRKFTWKYGFEINLSDEKRILRRGNAVGQSVASQTPIVVGGPVISYHAGELELYEKGLMEADAVKLKEADEYALHELLHMFQEIRNPGQVTRETLGQIAQLAQDSITGKPAYDYNNDPDEAEAWTISKRMVEPLNGLDVKDFPWPFGRFFSFS